MGSFGTSVTMLILLGGCDRVFELGRLSDAAIDAAPTTYEVAVLQDEPAAYFRLDEPGGPTAANRVMGGPAGNYMGAIRFGAAGALLDDSDTAIAINGVDGAVDVGDNFDFPNMNAFSLEAWLNPQNDPAMGFHNVVGKWHDEVDGAQNHGYLIFYQGSELTFSRENPGDTSVDLAQCEPLPSNAYTYVVATFDSITLRLYMNANECGSMAAHQSLPVTTDDFLIGAGEAATISPTLGSIDEVAVYTSALGQDRIIAHYMAAGYP